MASKDPPDVAATLHGASLLSARASIAYYELGRWAFQVGAKMGNPGALVYLVCVAGVFACGVVCAAVVGYLSFYANTMTASHLSDSTDSSDSANSTASPMVSPLLPTDDSPRTQFVRKVAWITKLAAALFFMAMFFEFGAVLTVGYTYFPTADLRFVFVAAGGTSVIVNSFILRYIVRTRRNLQKGGLANHDMVQFGEQPIPMAGRPLMHPIVAKEASMFSNRAVFISSFIMASSTRYILNYSIEGDMFVWFIALACLLNMTTLLCVSVLEFNLSRLVGDAQKEAFVQDMTRLWFWLKTSFLAATTLLLAGIATVGWGGMYVGHEFITLAAGSVALVGLAVCKVMYHKSLNAAHATPDAPITRSQQRAIRRIQLQSSPTGSTATIFASFVLYNVVTFHTDVQSLMYNELNGDVFLWVNSFVFTIAVMIVMWSTWITMGMGRCHHDAAKAVFASKMYVIGRLCFILFVVCQIGFVFGFGLYGVTKFNPMKYQPMFVAFGTIALMGVTSVYVYFKYRAAAKVDEEHARQESGDFVLDRRPVEVLATTAGRSLFFAGFSYFAINFFFKPGNPFANVYLWENSISVGCGLFIVLLNTVIQMALEDLDSPQAKHTFIVSVSWLCRAAFVIFQVSVLFFLLAFTCIGQVKKFYTSLTHGKRIAHIMMGGGFAAIALFVRTLGRVFRAYRRAKTCAAPAVSSSFSVSRVLAESDTLAAGAAFVSGNVFFEILFSDKHYNQPMNFAYFLLATTTLVLGTQVVVMVSAFTAALSNIEDTDTKKRMAADLDPTAYVFACQNLSQVTWLLSLCVMGFVKYPTWWYLTSSLGVASLGIMLGTWRAVQVAWRPLYTLHGMSSSQKYQRKRIEMSRDLSTNTARVELGKPLLSIQ